MNNYSFLLSLSSNKILLALPSKSSYCLFLIDHKKAIKPPKLSKNVIGIKIINVNIAPYLTFILKEFKSTIKEDADIERAAMSGVTFPVTARDIAKTL